MRHVFILERVDTDVTLISGNRSRWQLTLPRGHWIERAVMRFTRWPIESARIGNNTTDYSVIFIGGNTRKG